MTAAIVLPGLCLGAFFFALRNRWFARFERGFLITMMLAIAGFAFLGAVVSGVWQYQAGRGIVLQQVVDGLGNAGTVIEQNLGELVRSQVEQLSSYGKSLEGKLDPRKRSELGADLRYMDLLNVEVLQIEVFGPDGQSIASSSLTAAEEPLDHTAVGVVLDGNRYVSDATFSAVARRFVLVIGVPIRDPEGVVNGALVVRTDLQRAISLLIGATHFGGDGYAVVANHAGRILAHPDATRIGQDISSYPAVREALQGRRGWVTGQNAAGRDRLFVYQPITSPGSLNPVSWVLLTEIDESKALAPVNALGLQFLAALALFTIPGLFLGRQVATSISRPVEQLVQFVRMVQEGDLSARVEIGGADEIGRLGTALNEMAHGLSERDRIRDLFGRYVATQVSEKILKGEVSLGGESRRVTILFSDIRNFTGMAEQMSPDQVVAFLNDYFSEMVEAVFGEGGVLDKFIGDGMMAVFGSMEEMPDHPRRAVRAALRMKVTLAKLNGERSVAGKPPIGIGIGIHTDDVVVGNIGTRRRLEYTVVGDGVNTCSRVEALNKELGTTILITQNTYDEIKDEFVCRAMPAHEIRGKTKNIALYEVISTK